MNDQSKTNEQLLEELARERERSLALAEVSKRVAGAHDTDQILDLIVNEAARLVGAPWAFVALVEEGKSTPRASTENAADYLAEIVEAQPTLNIETGTSAMGHMLATRTPHVYEDTQEDELATAAGRDLAKKYGLHGGVLVPLLANDMPLGALAIMDKRIRRFTDDEVTLLTAFADQASLALEKARLLNEAEKERERSDALYRVSNQLASVHDTDEVLDRIVNEAARLVGAKAGFIRLWEGGIGVPTAATTSAADYLAEIKALNLAPTMEDKTGAGRVMATMKPLVLEDATTSDWVIPQARMLCEKHGLYGMALIPLMVNGRPIGLLSVFDGSQSIFTDGEVSLLSAFADQASLALEKARLLNEAESEKERAETERERADSLYRISNLLAGAHDTDEVLDLIVNEAARLVATPAAVIRLLEGDVLVMGPATEAAAAYAAESARLMPGLQAGEGSAAGRLLDGKKPTTSPDGTQDKGLFPETRALLQKHGFHGSVAIPLVANDRPVGTLTLIDTQIRRFTDDEVSLLTAFADQASLALEKARLLNEAEARERQATQLYEVTTQLASNHDLDSVLDLIAASAVELLECEAAMVTRYDDQKEGLVPTTLYKFDDELAELMQSVVIAPGVGTAGKAFQERRAVWSRDLSLGLTDRLDLPPEPRESKRPCPRRSLSAMNPTGP